MKYKVGFIGCGNMASAIMGGLINNANISPSSIIASDASKQALNNASSNLSINTTSNNCEVASESEVLFLSIKPQYYEVVINEIKTSLTPEQIVITIAPGKTIEWLTSKLGDNIKIVRTMPNTPALVGEGITGVCKNNLVTDDEFTYVMSLLGSFGLAEAIPESLMDVCVSVSGSSPAYVFMFIEAMADAAVADGMPRNQAYKFAAQAVLGSAKMVKCEPTVNKYLGITLLPQAGVALGMSLTALELGNADGALVRNIVLFSVLVYELVGPMLTKMALQAAGEIKPEGKKSSRGATDMAGHRRARLGLHLHGSKNEK